MHGHQATVEHNAAAGIGISDDAYRAAGAALADSAAQVSSTADLIAKGLELQFGPRATTLFATAETIEIQVLAADLVIGAVLVPGAAAPKLVTREMVRRMRPGSVLVDIAIDQGGCFETSRPTTHSHPTYEVDERSEERRVGKECRSRWSPSH